MSPQPQSYVAVVDPSSGVLQQYVTLVDSSGNLVYQANNPPQGRITLTTAVPVLTGAVAAATTVFYTPYVGNIIPLWNGSRFIPEVFSELSNVLANSAVGNAGPAAGAASSNYDLFVWKSGTSIFLTRGPVWTNATTRSAGTAIAQVQGIYVNSVAITNGPGIGYGTYVGTIRTDSGGATVSFSPGASTDSTTASNAVVNIWNMYNRREAVIASQYSTASWNYTSSTYQSPNNVAGMRLQVIRGLDEDAVWLEYAADATTNAAANSFAQIAIGLDSGTVAAAPAGRPGILSKVAATAVRATITAKYSGYPGVGWHILFPIERADNTNAVTFTGAGGTGLTGKVLY